MPRSTANRPQTQLEHDVYAAWPPPAIRDSPATRPPTFEPPAGCPLQSTVPPPRYPGSSTRPPTGHHPATTIRPPNGPCHRSLACDAAGPGLRSQAAPPGYAQAESETRRAGPDRPSQRPGARDRCSAPCNSGDRLRQATPGRRWQVGGDLSLASRQCDPISRSALSSGDESPAPPPRGSTRSVDPRSSSHRSTRPAHAPVTVTVSKTSRRPGLRPGRGIFRRRSSTPQPSPIFLVNPSPSHRWKIGR